MRNLGTKLIVLGSISILAVLLVAGTANARTRGFTIYNFSSDSVKLTDLMAYGLPAGEPVFQAGSVPPKVGMVLDPGESYHFELENPFSYTRRAQLEFRGGGSAFHIVADNQSETRCTTDRQCEISNGESDITFLDLPGSRNVLKADNLQGQAKALKELCTKINKCDFEPLERRQTYTPSQVYGSTVTNCDEEAEVETKIEAERTFEISNSVGVESESEFEVYGLFKEKVTLKYEIEITEKEKFAQDVAVKVKPEHVAWVAVSVPVWRYTGTYTLRLGNTEWVLEGVYFDEPDKGRSGHFIADQAKLTEQQKEDECSHAPPGNGLLSTSAALVFTRDHGSGKADLFRGGPESNFLHGHGGNDLIRGGGGHDTIFGGAGRDWIKGGPGEDTLNGGAGADRIDDVRGPTTVQTGGNATRTWDRVDVADGRGDDTVTCQTPRSIVFADRGDKIGPGCGKVIRSK